MGFFSRLLGRAEASSKLAEVGVEAAAAMQSVPARPDYREVGLSGTRISGGKLTNRESNADLQGPRGYRALEDLLRTDPACAAANLAVTQTLLSAKWEFRPTEDPQSQRAAEFLNLNFGFAGKRGRIKGGWEQNLRKLLRFVPLGVRYAEEIYEVADGHVWLSRLADRDFGIHDEWVINPDTGELAAVVQQDTGDGRKRAEKAPPTIPANKLIVLTMAQSAMDWEGTGLLRPVWIWAKAKRTILDLLCVGVERFAIPTPLVSIDRDKLAVVYNDAQINEMAEAARSQLELYTSHEAAHLLTTAGIDISTYGDGVFDPSKCLSIIEACDHQIMQGFTVGFLQMGLNGEGSRALGEVAQSFFLRSCVNVLDQVAQVVGGPAGPGTGTVGRLLRFNFPSLPESEYPRMEHSGLTPSALLENLPNVMALKAAGMLRWSEADEAAVRPLLGLAPAVEPAAQEGAAA